MEYQVKKRQKKQPKQHPASHEHNYRKLRNMSEQNKLLTIGRLAKQTGELVTTIRFWAKEGLLTVKDYSQGGYQLFEPSMAKRVKEIRRLQKEERLTIAEIKEKSHRFFKVV